MAILQHSVRCLVVQGLAQSLPSDGQGGEANQFPVWRKASPARLGAGSDNSGGECNDDRLKPVGSAKLLCRVFQIAVDRLEFEIGGNGDLLAV